MSPHSSITQRQSVVVVTDTPYIQYAIVVTATAATAAAAAGNLSYPSIRMRMLIATSD